MEETIDGIEAMERGAVISDFEKTIALSFAGKPMRQSLKECPNAKPEDVVAAIEDPTLEKNLPPGVFECFERNFRPAIVGAKPDPSALETLVDCAQHGWDVYISSNGFCSAIEQCLKKPDFTGAESFLVYGREDGPKQDQTDAIIMQDDYDLIVIIGNSPSDFRASVLGEGVDLRVVRIAVNVADADKKFFEDAGIKYSTGPLTKEMFAKAVKQ
jgi:hypothetical protein